MSSILENPFVARHWVVLGLGLCLFMVLFSYWGVWSYGYVWDDYTFFLKGNTFRSFSHFWPTLGAPLVLSADYYRPLALASFFPEVVWGGLNPAIPHVTNLVLHLASTALLFDFIRRSGASLLAAILGALFFGLHPALVEAVAWISGRFDLMATFFLLLGLWGWRLTRGRWLPVLALCLGFFLAAFCKESVAPFPLLMGGLVFLDQRREGLSLGAALQRSLLPQWRLWLGLVLTGCAYLAIRYGVLGYLLHPVRQIPQGAGTPWQHGLLVGKSLMAYCRTMVFPFASVSPVHSTLLPVAAHDRWALGALIGALILPWVLLGGVARNGPWGRIAGYSLLALVAVVPVINLRPMTIADSFYQDRFLMLPAVFFALAVATWADAPVAAVTAARRQALTYAKLLVVGLWLMGAAYTVSVTAPLWQRDLTLWTWAQLDNPDSGYVAINRAMGFLQLGKGKEGEASLAEFSRQHPGNFPVLAKMIAMELGRNDLSAASHSCDQVLALGGKASVPPPLKGTCLNLQGIALGLAGNGTGAEAKLRTALEVLPGEPVTQRLLGNTLLARGETAEACRYLALAARGSKTQADKEKKSGAEEALAALTKALAKAEGQKAPDVKVCQP